MKLQTQPNRWSCLPTAFAMALDVKVGMILKWLGHDGSVVARPELPEPDCYLGFHIQELVGYAWWLGFATTPFEARPRSVVGDQVVPIEFAAGNAQRLINVMQGRVGVLTGQSLPRGNHHAVAWDGQKIYNPNGTIQTLDDFAIGTFWCVTPLK